jgi:hypothetical protein
MRTKLLLFILLLVSLAVASAANAQISISVGDDGKSSVSLGGQITLPDGVAKSFGDIDNTTFKCSIVSGMRKYLFSRAKAGDTLAAMVSDDRAVSMDTEAGHPVMAMIKGSDGSFRTVIPATLVFKTDVQPGTVLRVEGFDVEVTRPIKAGESIPALYFGGEAVLSTASAATAPGGASLLEPMVRVFPGKVNRAAIVGVWRIARNLH